MILDASIFAVVIASAFALIRGKRRHAQHRALEAALNRALAPQPLTAKYFCLMSDDEVKTMNTSRWD